MNGHLSGSCEHKLAYPCLVASSRHLHNRTCRTGRSWAQTASLVALSLLGSCPHTSHPKPCTPDPPLGFTNNDFLQSIMNGLGVPYDVAPTPLGNLTQLLWNADGSAKYAGYVM